MNARSGPRRQGRSIRELEEIEKGRWAGPFFEMLIGLSHQIAKNLEVSHIKISSCLNGVEAVFETFGRLWDCSECADFSA